MKKLFILTMFLVLSNNALALECGESQSVTSTEESKIEVTTNTPKFLRNATITLTKADGSKEVLKAEDYMIVKRKHSRPVIKETTKEMSLACKNTQSDRKNIISLKAVDGYSDVKKQENGQTTSIKVDRQVGVGLQYQRAVTERVYLGVGADSNRGAEALLGVGF